MVKYFLKITKKRKEVGEIMQQSNQNIYDKLISTFKSNKFHTDVNNDVFIEKVIDDIIHQKPELIRMILSDEVLKKAFFQEVEGALIFKPKELIEALSAENKFLQSKTTYSQSIGLTRKDDFIVAHDDVVLAFPFKDTVFAGGQEKDDQKSKENFLHGIINANEVARLLEPKVMTNIKRYSKDGIETNPTITENDNLIIKGNNLLALHSLLDKADGTPLYRGKVKLIYIDPPYNTGNNSFNYNDNFSHSTWLTFMKNRLEVVREFLRDDGVIYISLDDKEFHYCKVLSDEIFGRENFVGNIAWESKTKSQNTKDSYNKLQPKVEHILVYTKQSCRRFNLVSKGEKEYPLSDSNGNYREYVLETMNAEDVRGRSTMIFDIEGIVPPQGKQWKLGKDSIDEFTGRGDLFIRDNKVVIKKRPEDENTEITEPFWGFLSKEIGTAESAKKELSEILGTKSHGFDTVKPVELIKRLVFHASDKDDIILDFHAGSGTTAHAVLDLNKEDGGNRKFILIEQMDYIETITRKRVKKVIEKNAEGSFVYMELKKIDDFQHIPQSEDEKLNKIKMKLSVEMAYLPYSEMEDAMYKIPRKEKEANHHFYGVDDE